MCLVSDGEISRKSPGYLAAIQRDQLPANLWRFDVPDYGMPDNPDELKQVLDLLLVRLCEGESVVIHCAAGHGRTGMVSTLLLVRMGLPLHQAVQAISEAGSAPDTDEQRQFLSRTCRH